MAELAKGPPGHYDNISKTYVDLCSSSVGGYMQCKMQDALLHLFQNVPMGNYLSKFIVKRCNKATISLIWYSVVCLRHLSTVIGSG